jgi:hypothetical protein
VPEPIRLVDLHDLVGRSEIAERAKVKLAAVDTWRRRYDTFPAPMGTISGTPIWFWPEVKAWIDDTPRDVGRPPTDTRMIARTPLPDRLRDVIRRMGTEDDISEANESA